MSEIDDRLNIVRQEVAKWNSLFQHPGWTPVLVALAIAEDSTLNPQTTGNAGEYGVLQLRPIALKDVEQSFRFTPSRDSIEESVKAGAHFLNLCMQYAANCGMPLSVENVVAVWNMGVGNACSEYNKYLSAGKDPNTDRSWMYPKTKELVDRLLQALPAEIQAFNEGLYHK
jgi:membrane-bound lytic murein transglycosylase MltF